MTYNTAMAIRIVSAITCGSIIGAGIHSAMGAERRTSFGDRYCATLHAEHPETAHQRVGVICHGTTKTSYFMCNAIDGRMTKPIDAPAPIEDERCANPFK